MAVEVVTRSSIVDNLLQNSHQNDLYLDQGGESQRINKQY